MKKLIIVLTGLVLSAILFAGGMFAAQWLSFTGDDQAVDSNNDVDQIMQILRDTHEGKISAENALAELEELNPAGLAKNNKELREENEQLKNNNAQLSTDLNAKQKEIDEKNTAYDQLQQERDSLQSTIDDLNNQIAALNESNNGNTEYIAHLEAELQRANETMTGLNNKTGAALEEAKTIVEGE